MPPFFPPNRGKNHIWKCFPDSDCGAIFWITIYKRQFLHNNMSINPRSVEFHQCHAKRHSICFFLTTISKITTEISVKICWQLNSPTWKCTRCIMQMTTWTRQTFLSKPFTRRSTCRNNTEKCLGKELWRVLVVDNSTDHDKPDFDLFSATISTSKKFFFYWEREKSASWKRHCATHWREQRSMVGT